MPLKVEKAAATGFCFGVKRAVDKLEKVARERGRVEALGAIVHNQQVLQKLAEIGVKVANSLDNIEGNTVAIGAHGVDPQLEKEIREYNLLEELSTFFEKIDDVALISFDIYTKCRDTLYEIRVEQAKNQVSGLLKRSGLTCEIPEWESELGSGDRDQGPV